MSRQGFEPRPRLRAALCSFLFRARLPLTSRARAQEGAGMASRWLVSSSQTGETLSYRCTPAVPGRIGSGARPAGWSSSPPRAKLVGKLLTPAPANRPPSLHATPLPLPLPPPPLPSPPSATPPPAGPFSSPPLLPHPQPPPSKAPPPRESRKDWMSGSR